MPSNASSGLIYDVGLHFGHDTAFYLNRGFRVLAIEADPALANKATVRFEREIAAERLTILNVGIAEQSGESTFWICDDASAWNSFSEKIASRDGSRHHAITIPTMTVRDVFALHGVPDYMKVDIEGNDHLCLLGLDRNHLPRFISLEAECLGDAERISDEDAIANLNRLQAVGYSKFKLISQADLHAVGWRSGFSHLVQRAIHSLAGGRLGKTLGRMARPFTVAAAFERRYGVDFPEGSSGPWGDEADGGWLAFDQARHIYLHRRHAHFSNGKNAAYSFWHDWHATV